MKFIIILALCLTLCISMQVVPVPLTYDGFSMGSSNAPVHLEVFYDLLCPASAASNEQINALFSNSTISKYLPQIRFTYHIFPLPYHDYAFNFAQLFRQVYNNYSSRTTFEFINFIFDIQDQYWNGPTQTSSRLSVFNKLANQVHDKFPHISVDEVNAALTNTTLNSQARYSWKYGASRYVSGTPIYFLNGVQLDGAEGFGSKIWAETLLPYVQAAQSPAEVDLREFYTY